MADAGKPVTVIGPDTHIKGEMAFDSSARILGTFEGSIQSKGEVHVGDGATCRASVDAARITVDGLVEGNLTARERVELNANARIVGDITAATLVVAAGASFNGHVRVGPNALTAAKMPEPPTAVETKPVRARDTEPAEGLLAGPPQVRAGWVGSARVAAQ